jgi:hypothetical protein
MKSRSELIERVKRANMQGDLRTVVAQAIERISGSAQCKIDASESRLPAAHYARIYQRRANNPTPAVKDIPGLLASLENFSTEHGNLELLSCSLDNGSVAFWFSDKGDIVGCMLLAST